MWNSVFEARSVKQQWNTFFAILLETRDTFNSLIRNTQKVGLFKTLTNYANSHSFSVESNKIFGIGKLFSWKIFILPTFETCSLCALLDNTCFSYQLKNQVKAIGDYMESLFKNLVWICWILCVDSAGLR